MTPRLFVSCGESSGDLYAGALVRELTQLSPGIEVAGLGGPQFAGAGGRLIADYHQLTVTGLTEAITKIPESLVTIRRLAAAARELRPQALVVIDFPDFNFRLAKTVAALGIPVIYYVSPQIWAWRPGRIKTIRKTAREVLVIFPFEQKIYQEAGIPVTFVGHPLIDLLAAAPPRDTVLSSAGLDLRRPVVALLPGSRTNEVHRILPVLIAAVPLIRAQVPNAQFLVARAPGLADVLYEPLRAIGGLAVVEQQTDAVLAAADVAVTASGTATVQTALHDTPMVVVYKLSPLTYKVGRPLVKLDTFAMVNLIVGERVVPELIQDDCTPDAVAREVTALLSDRARRETMRAGLARVRERLGGPGASRRAASAILAAIGEPCVSS